MDRRIFLKGVLGGGAIGAMPLAAMAKPGGLGAERAVVVLAQAEVPQALGIARALAAEARVMPVVVGAERLGSFAEVTGLLERAGGTRVIGVMDDARALIFQQIAAARGAAVPMDMHRRVGGASLVSFAIDT